MALSSAMGDAFRPIPLKNTAVIRGVCFGMSKNVTILWGQRCIGKISVLHELPSNRPRHLVGGQAADRLSDRVCDVMLTGVHRGRYERRCKSSLSEFLGTDGASLPFSDL